MQLGRLWRTVRWLKASQIVGRIRFRLAQSRVDLRPPPPVHTPASQPSRPKLWVQPAARETSLLAPTRQRFLGAEHDLAQVGWDSPALPLLWRYNQHYFDDLHASNAGGRREWHRALMGRWIDENPPARGTGWAPYPASLRIVNWIKWFLGGEAPPQEWLASLAVQVRWLERRLEWHLLGNHLFVNAKALIFAGLYFEGPEAARWLVTGLDILEHEMAEQILADGGQFERSPMYHALALEDLLDLLNVLRALGGSTANDSAQRLAMALEPRTSRMLHWLRCLSHPNGTLARFNDTAEGIAPPTLELERYAAALGIVAAPAPGEGVLPLQPSGYVRATRGAAVALLDVAPIGPDYLPGHAHADTLSFELAVYGFELVVNRGTSEYGDGRRRQSERGTQAHSTVQVGAHDSSEVWAGFRVGRRARPREVQVQGWTVSAAHDGYAHLPGRPLHYRSWHLEAQSLHIVDRVEPLPNEPCVARFHLAPGLQCEPDGEGQFRVLREGRMLAHASVGVGVGRLEPWQHARRFGELVPATTLAVTLQAGVADVRWSWAA